jgi:hypothetical protein
MKQLTTQEILAKFTSDEREQFLNSWPTIRCGLCYKAAATGIWWLQFASSKGIYSQLKTLCAGCGMTDCYKKWTGFMGPKLIRCDLFATISCPEGDKRTAWDKLIEKIESHPSGKQYLLAWQLAFRPANRSHPLLPAQRALRNIYDKLFPTQDNKVD